MRGHSKGPFFVKTQEIGLRDFICVEVSIQLSTSFFSPQLLSTDGPSPWNDGRCGVSRPVLTSPPEDGHGEDVSLDHLILPRGTPISIYFFFFKELNVSTVRQ